MSYERLTERLIETQQSMLGRRAVNVAQSVDGLAVADDGTVSAVDGGDDHDRTVIAALVDEYVSIMGQSAHNRLDGVADEFGDDLVLPEVLGGPADIDVEDTDESAATAPETDAGDERADTENEAATDETEATAERGTTDAAESDEIVTNIWGEEYASEETETDADPSSVDIESVYITVTDEGGWEQPIPVRRAIVEAVTNVTDLTEADLADLSTYVETHRIVRLLETDATDPVSFEVEGHRVTLHADGGILVE